MALHKKIKSSDIGVSVVNWKFRGQDIDSTEAINSLQNLYSDKPIKSQVVEEIHRHAEYHVIVDIKQDGSNEVSYQICVLPIYPSNVYLPLTLLIFSLRSQPLSQ